MKSRSFSGLVAGALLFSLTLVGNQVSAPVLASQKLAQNQAPATPRAQAVQLQLSAQKQVVTQDAQGKPQTSWQAINTSGSAVQPGDVIRYTVSSKNTSTRPVSKFTLTQPIPKGTQFVLGSVTPAATPEMPVLYSIDQGKSFVAQPTVQVRDSNGQLVSRPAPAEAYTHIRWQFRQALSPAMTLQNTYQVKVR